MFAWERTTQALWAPRCCRQHLPCSVFQCTGQACVVQPLFRCAQGRASLTCSGDAQSPDLKNCTRCSVSTTLAASATSATAADCQRAGGSCAAAMAPG